MLHPLLHTGTTPPSSGHTLLHTGTTPPSSGHTLLHTGTTPPSSGHTLLHTGTTPPSSGHTLLHTGTTPPSSGHTLDVLLITIPVFNMYSTSIPGLWENMPECSIQGVGRDKTALLSETEPVIIRVEWFCLYLSTPPSIPASHFSNSFPLPRCILYAPFLLHTLFHTSSSSSTLHLLPSHSLSPYSQYHFQMAYVPATTPRTEPCQSSRHHWPCCTGSVEWPGEERTYCNYFSYSISTSLHTFTCVHT